MSVIIKRSKIMNYTSNEFKVSELLVNNINDNIS